MGCVALASCYIAEVVVYLVKKKKLQLFESALITGLILGFVLSSEMAWWQFSLAAVLAILSKHLIQLKKRLIFNPAAMGALLVIVLSHGLTQWKGAYTWYLIIPFGLYFAFKTKKLVLVGAYFLTSLVLFGIQKQIQHTPLIDVVLYLNYFFIFIMLLEPKTSPFKNKETIAFGVGVSVLAFLFYIFKFPYGTEIPSLLIANFFYRILTLPKKERSKMNKNLTRLEFLKVSAKSFFAPLLLTACGNLISLTGCAAPKAGEVTVDGTNFITDLATLREAKALNFVLAGKRSILLYNDGRIKAFQNICTHEDGPTKLTGSKLVCQWHGATFDPLTGESTGRPAPTGSKLPEIPLEIKGEKIYVARK